MSLALLFPGQGGQHAGMLPWLDDAPQAQPALAAMAHHLGPDWRSRLQDADWLHTNAVAQPLLTALGVAAWQALAARLPPPAAVAGYSVGELAAFAVAGVIAAADAIDLAAARAAAMDACAGGSDTGLMCVQGLQALALAGAEPMLSLAIRISAERVIVGGDTAALDEAGTRWTALGLRCARLPVRVASHTPRMAPAAAEVARRLAALRLNAPRATVVCNHTGAGHRQPATLAAALAGQIASTVLWDDCMDTLAERGVRCVLEVGPGTALAAMWRERHPGIPARALEEFKSPDGVAGWVQQQCA